MNIEEEILKLVKKANPDNPMSFVQNIVKEISLDKMNEAICSCNECSISNGCVKTKGQGCPNASILILGESANEYHQDLKDGELPVPFYYGDESIILGYLNEIGVDMDEIYLMNSIQCMPIDSTGARRTATVKERRTCKTYVDYAIDTVKPLLIIATGGVAINTINEDIGSQSVSNIRGKIFYYRGIPVMPTYHPLIVEILKKNTDQTEDMLNKYYEHIYNDIVSSIEFFKQEYENINIFK